METANIGYPDVLASFETKKSKAYGLQMARIISSQWFGGGMINAGCEYWSRRDYVRRKRLFVRGEMGQQYFKDAMVKMDGELNELNLDFSTINWGEKFCRIVSNGLNDDNYRLDIRATDKLSVLEKQRQQDKYLKYMISREMLKKAKEMQGIDLLPPDLPDDEEELKMVMEIKDKPRIEIAEELLIDWIMKTNEWDFLSGQYDKDIVDVGLMVARVHIDKNNGVSLSYCDPEHYIHSPVSRNDFADKYYDGYVETVTINDIIREGHGELTDDEIRKIAKCYSGNNKGMLDYTQCAINDVLNYRVNVCRFAYKTNKTVTYKGKLRKGELVEVHKKNDDFKSPDYPDTKTVSGSFDTWMEGTFIIGSDILYNYRECENVYDDVMNRAMSPFITMAWDIYDNRLRSFSDNIEVHVKQLQKVSLKIQHLVSELTPDLKEIDIDMLAELDNGKGGVKKQVWEEALKIMRVHGVVFKKRIDTGEMGIKEGVAAQPHAVQQGSALTVLLNVAAYHYNQIRETTGVNPARDGSMQPDALVGVNQLAQIASNTVTADIVKASWLFKKAISETISTRIHTIYSYKGAEKIREIYNNVVGKSFFDAIEVMKNRHLHEFGFTFEMYPTSQEMQEFREDMAFAVQSGAVPPEVKFRATQIARTNTKLAIEYLRYNTKKFREQQMKEQMALAQNKSQNDSAAAQAKAQADMQAYAAKSEIDVQKAAKLSQIKLMEAQGLQQISAPVEDKEFQQEVYLAKIKETAKWSAMEFSEDRKDDRTAIQATQQSKLKKQAETGGKPIDFENENNWYTQSL